MNKIYFLFMLLLALFFTSAQSLKVEYEVQFKSKDTPELTGSSDFQNKIKSLMHIAYTVFTNTISKF